MTLPGSAQAQYTYQTFLYRKALHPELFALKARRTFAHNDYELEVWLTPGGHVARFRAGNFSCCELVTDCDDRLPVEGAVTGFPCTGEHEFEHRFAAERVNYITSVQTETLSENLYNATYEEMTEFAKEVKALVYAWTDVPRLGNGTANLAGRANGFATLPANGSFHPASPSSNGHANGNGHAAYSGALSNGRARAARGPGNLSLVDVQKLNREVHCQSYHLIAQIGLVLRTQTIFEHL